jgi:SAM-dependent methyltransferase
MTDVFLEEYTADEAVRRYGTDTAGHGISYLLEHDYGRIYRRVLTKYLPAAATRDGVRLLEFGCGAGMNLIHLVGQSQSMNIPVARAYGADFSPRLIEAARADAARIVTARNRNTVEFVVARNETIVADMAAGTGVAPDALLGSFHLVFGVNTFRYCHRMHKEVETARQLFDLLAPGCVCVIIDMNTQFPFFRSKLKPGQYNDDSEVYIPVLEEYVRPLSTVGFEILEARNFCWVPHSAGPALCKTLRMLTPLLDTVASRYAMRSLVIARRPA